MSLLTFYIACQIVFFFYFSFLGQLLTDKKFAFPYETRLKVVSHVVFGATTFCVGPNKIEITY